MKHRIFLEQLPEAAKVYPEDNGYWVTPDGRIFSTKLKRPYELKQFRLNKKTDYQCVGCTKDGRVRKRYVHRMVAETFLPRVSENLEVNHIDHNKTNNVVENLEWVSRVDNMRKAYEYHRGYGVTKMSN